MFTQHSMNMMIEEAWTMPSLKQLRRRSWAASSSGMMQHEQHSASNSAEVQNQEEPSFVCHPSHSNEPKQQQSNISSSSMSLPADSEPDFLVTPMAHVVARPNQSAAAALPRYAPSGLTNESNTAAMNVNANANTITTTTSNSHNVSNNLVDLAQQLQNVIDGPLSTVSSPGRLHRIQERRLSLSNIPSSPPRNDWRNESLGSFPIHSPSSPAVHPRTISNSPEYNMKNHMNSIASLSLSDLSLVHDHGNKNNNNKEKASPSCLQNTISTAVLTPQGSEDSMRSRDTVPSFFADLCNAVTASPLTNTEDLGGCVKHMVVQEEDEEVESCRSVASTIGSAASTVTLTSWPSISSVSSATHHEAPQTQHTRDSTVAELATCAAVAATVGTTTFSSAGHMDIPNEIEIMTIQTYESPKPKYFTLRHSTEMPMLGLLPTTSMMSIPRRSNRPMHNKGFSTIPPRSRLRRRSNDPTAPKMCPSLVTARLMQKEHKCQLHEIQLLLNEWDERNRALLQEQQCAMSTLQRLGRN